MKRQVLPVAAFAVAVMSLVGCSGTQESGLQPAQDQAAATQPEARPSADSGMAAQVQVVSGELDNVDLQAKTFTVIPTGDPALQFNFTDDTEVVGAAGMQGLATREKPWVTVHYRPGPDGDKVAVKIELP